MDSWHEIISVEQMNIDPLPLKNFLDRYAHYNPQNEMFSHLGTKRYNFKNETQLFKVIPHTSKFQKNRPASPERNTFEGS